jgi:cellulose synthase operon protein C
MNRFFAPLACALAAAALLGCSGGASDAELLANARAALDKQDIPTALIQVKNALAKNPDSGEARLLLGKTLLRGGDPVNALVELQRAQDAQLPDSQVMPEIARALLAAGEPTKVITQHASLSLPEPEAMADVKTSLASAYAANGNPELARGAVAAALAAKPGYAPAVVVGARLIAADGDIDGALRQLDQVLAADAGHEAAGLLKAEMLLRAKNDPAGALERYLKVREANPRSVPAHSAIVNLLIEQGKGPQARKEFEQLKQQAPNHPETLFLQAGFAFDDQDYKASREITDRLLAAAPNNPRVLVLAGAAEYRMQRYTLAQGMLARALKAAPDAVSTRQLLAQAFLGDGLPDRALEVLQPVIDSPKADATSLSLAGEAYLRAGDARRSEAVFQRALKTAPQDARLRTSAALAQLGRGDSAAAVAQLQALAREDGGISANLALVSAKLRQEDPKGALQAIDELEKKAPTRALAFDLRGRVLAAQGDTAGATANYNKALEKEPNYFPAAVALAALEFNTGKPELARQRFEAMIKADPKNFRPRLALAELDNQMGVAEATITAQLKEATKVAPAQPEPHLALIDHLINSRNPTAALQAAQDATSALPSDLRIMAALGHAQLLAGEAQRSVSTLKQLAGLQPKNPEPLTRLAEALVATKDTDAAVQTLRQAITLQPDHLPAQRSLALLLAGKRPQEGLEIARSLQKRLPKDAEGFVLEAEIEERAKNWGAAATAYQAALQRRQSTELAIRLHGALNAAGKGAEAQRLAGEWQKARPKDAAFVFYLGDQALAAKSWAKAEELYRAVLALQPRNAVVMNNIAWLLASQRKPGAVEMAEKANALLPERAALLDTLAFAQEAENRLDLAVVTQQRAVALEPRAPELRLRLAQLLAKQGQKAEALKELEPLAQLGSGFAGQAEVAALMKTLR